jgi:hypothetical protein
MPLVVLYLATALVIVLLSKHASLYYNPFAGSSLCAMD